LLRDRIAEECLILIKINYNPVTLSYRLNLSEKKHGKHN